MSMSSPVSGMNAPELVAALRRFRTTDNWTNLSALAKEYLFISLVFGLAVACSLARQSAGWSWGWDLPPFAVAYLLMGGLQHRLAGLGHEAAHFTLFHHRWLNDLAGDLFCFFPLFATLHQYRVTHLAHHQFTNDWKRDPDLTDVGRPKGVHEFPMGRSKFVYQYFVRFLFPWVLLNYMAKLAYQSVFGRGDNPYLHDPRFMKGRAVAKPGIRWLSLAGVAYFFGLAIAMNQLFSIGRIDLVLLSATAVCAGALLVAWMAPDNAFFQSAVRSIYSSRFEAMLRLVAMTALLMFFPLARSATGVNVGAYFLVLWVGPLLTTMAYYMLLRDVYQHANADQGRLTNSRVFFSDRFTRWAVFVYGQDMHVPHHLYPAIPYYHLPEAHRCLKAMSKEYRDHVVECEGVFVNQSGRLTILDVMKVQNHSDASGPGSVPDPAQRHAA